MTHIMVPIDGSVHTDRAIQQLIDRSCAGETIRASLMYVHEPPIRYGKLLLYQSLEKLREFRAQRAANVLDSAAQRLGTAGITCTTMTAEGELLKTIDEKTGSLQCDEVILGTWRPPTSRFHLLRKAGIRNRRFLRRLAN
ncbi:MAG: universal stress protein [Gammaproteobacteria bacterium]